MVCREEVIGGDYGLGSTRFCDGDRERQVCVCVCVYMINKLRDTFQIYTKKHNTIQRHLRKTFFLRKISCLRWDMYIHGYIICVSKSYVLGNGYNMRRVGWL